MSPKQRQEALKAKFGGEAQQFLRNAASASWTTFSLPVRSEGNKVPASSLENSLQKNPLVGQVAVFEQGSDNFAAVVVPDPEASKGMSHADTRAQLDAHFRAVNSTLGGGQTINGFRVATLEPEEFTLQSGQRQDCLLYTSPSPRDQRGSRMPSSA